MGDILSKFGITFDEEKHQYARNGFPLPSVTQILPFKCDGPEDAIRKAAERGYRVHLAIEAMETRHPFDFDPEKQCEISDLPYLHAWLKFKEITGFELARIQYFMAGGIEIPQPMVERFVYHPQFNYVGRLDLIGYLTRIPKIENDLTLVDAKTVAAIYPTASLQTSAYMMAVNLELKSLGLPLVKHRWAAHLRPDGSCRRFSFEDHKGDFSVFLARLNWMRWAIANRYETVERDWFIESVVNEEADREIEEVMARL